MSEYVVIGMGLTGMSCVAYWHDLGYKVCVMDTRDNPPLLADLQSQYPDVSYVLGRIDVARCQRAAQVVVSPGLNPHHPDCQMLRAKGVRCVSDIDLFLAQVSVPVIGVTGSNGKSTVVSLLTVCCEAAGLRTLLCGNIGRPVLSCLSGMDADVVVLELSSFQCENSKALRLHAGTVLNITSDHMDWHGSMQAYVEAKRRIIPASTYYVENRDDEATHDPKAITSFGLSQPISEAWGLRDGVIMRGDRAVVSCQDLPLWGSHQWLNVMAACALAQTVGVTLDQCRHACEQFEGLPHRCQRVAVHDGVVWYNDSKGTNPGATDAALRAIMGCTSGQVVALLGGVAKDAEFAILSEALAKTKAVLVYGQDAKAIQASLPGIAMQVVSGVEEAVRVSAALARPGDAVCFSPACASWDQYKDYKARGEHYMACVRALS